tara:strand:- start:450 stop:683 length:234 start_codon:yes stop_codon:yes gene_type:complete
MMELDKQLKLGHLLLLERECRVCGEEKNLVDGFYRTRKNRGAVASSYSYECKVCTIKRIISSRNRRTPFVDWQYPDW